MPRFLPAFFCILTLAGAAPAMAQEFSEQDRAAVTARLESIYDVLEAGDMSGVMDVLPPGIVETLAARYGVTPEQAREAARQVAADAMSEVEVVDYRIDMDGAEVNLTPDGRRTYVILPLHLTMRVQNLTVTSMSPTLAFEVDGVWYAMNMDQAEHAAVLVEVYPEFSGVEFPKGTMDIVED